MAIRFDNIEAHNLQDFAGYNVLTIHPSNRTITLSGAATYHKIQTFYDGDYTSGFKFSDYNGGIWYDAGNDDLILNSGHANSQIFLNSGGALAVTINANQDVGIGSTGVYAGANAALNLPGKGLAIKNDKNGSNNNWSYINNTAQGSASNINFYTGNNSAALTLDHSGNATFTASTYTNGIVRSRKNIVSNSTYNVMSLNSSRTVNDYGGLNKDYMKIDLVTPGPNTDGGSSAHGFGSFSLKLANTSNSTSMGEVLNITAGGSATFPGELTVGASGAGKDVIFHGDLAGEYFMWDENVSTVNIIHRHELPGLEIYASASAQNTQPQFKVGRNNAQYWGVYTDDRNAHLVHRQDETSGVMTTRFDQWDSNTDDATGEWLWRSGDGTGGSMSTALTLTQAGAGSFADAIYTSKNGGAVAAISTPRIRLRTDGVIEWGATYNYGTLTWDTGKAVIAAQASKVLELKANNSTLGLTVETSGDVTFDKKISSSQLKFCNASISNSYVKVYKATEASSQLSSAVRITGTSHGNGHVGNFTALVLVNHYEDVFIRSNSGAYTQVTLKVESDNNGEYHLSVKSSSSNAATYYFTIEVLSDGTSITVNPTDTPATNTTHEHTTIFGSNESGEGGTMGHTFTGYLETHQLRSDVLNNKANSANLIYRSGTDTLVGGGTTANKLVVADGGNTTIGGTFTSNGTGTSSFGGTLKMLSGTSGTTAKILFETTDNNDQSKYIRTNAYWNEYGAHANEGHKFIDSSGNMLLQLNGVNSNSGNGALSATFVGKVVGTATNNEFKHGTAWGQNLRLTNTNNDSSPPILTFLKQPDGGHTQMADNDYIGFINFRGDNSNNDEFSWVELSALALDVTDGSEDSAFRIGTWGGGTEYANTLIASSGKVGLGVAAPSFQLQVQGTPPATNGALINARNSAATTSNTTFGGIFFNSAPGYDFSIGKSNVNTDTTLSFRNGNDGTSLMDITPTGNVGIGATSPEKKLHVKTATTDATPQVLIQNSSTGDASVLYNVSGQSYIIGIDYDDSKKFKIASSGNLGTTDRITLLSDGKVGIGTITPTVALSVAGEISSTDDINVGGKLVCANVGSDKKIAFRRSGANNFSIEHDTSSLYFYNETTSELPIRFFNNGDVSMIAGNVGIGVTSPQGALHVYNGSSERFLITGDVHVQGTTDLNINGTSRRLSFTAGTGTVRTTTANNLYLQSNSTTVLELKSNLVSEFKGPVVGESTIRPLKGLDWNTTDGMNSGTAAWRRLGTWSAGQSAEMLRLQIIGGSGYNAMVSQQGELVIVLRTSNGSSSQAATNGSAVYFSGYYYMTGQLKLTGSDIRVEVSGTDEYTIYMNTKTFIGQAPIIIDQSASTSFEIHADTGGSSTDFSSSNYLDIPQHYRIQTDLNLEGVDFSVDSGRKIHLDGMGGHTYLIEEGDNNLKFYVGGTEHMSIGGGDVFMHQPMQVASYIYHIGDTSTNIQFESSQITIKTAGNSHIQINNDENIYFRTNGTNRFKMDTGGTFTATADIVAYGSVSDKSYKENIKPITGALELVNNLKGVTFDWKEDTDTNKMVGLKEDIGFIAQDVQEVLPTLVRKNENGKLSLRDKGIVPVLVEAIKEQQNLIDKLVDRIEKLENK